MAPGYEKMADWAAAKFKEWGVKPAGENGTYFQSVPMTGPRSAFVWSTGVPSLSVNLLIADRKTQYDAMRFTVPSVNGAVAGQGGW